jgi:hypothetical protein
MKTLDELIHDLPLDHLIAAILVVASLVFITWELIFTPTEEKEEKKKEVTYYVEPPGKPYHNLIAILVFIITLAGVTLVLLHILNTGVTRGRP